MEKRREEERKRRERLRREAVRCGLIGFAGFMN
jgi:hypothetical protein